ncbi:hypothetical protein [Streptomyces chattanoogensis]|uniref:hypothetical protein n=1 Tax=Streptomyces chattanoogensis TaxID=66876 RepID=UPI0005D9A6FD|nr:hypothetical protein T261_0382 [Streptomyces lydicus]
MRRRISAFAVTAAMAGGVLFAALPAHAATLTGSHAAVAGGSIHVNLDELRQQSADLKAKANRLDQDGEHEAAERARAEANAIDNQIKAYEDAENNV